MRRTLKANQTQHDIPESLESYLNNQGNLYPRNQEEAMLEAIWTENDEAPALTKSFLQKLYKLKYSQEMPSEELGELAVFIIHFVRKTPKDRLAKFLAYTLNSKI
ncbi:hypothetical protein H1R16_02930 [Marnyiella aurantia]|uniref:Uncharacterized protein n=1 Tax=Marnyiella aurantia TaxID=2758037 RepID=A0A7D7LN50_9FLAO|nr:hypothetical protein [Marnyiella aurantia]MBA5245611.1 hypothetical protein [Marnyiella aurantia]QMS98979.1 hypothetical protein H1R16_02930 [Marnyiella aurantia]